MLFGLCCSYRLIGSVSVWFQWCIGGLQHLSPLAELLFAARVLPKFRGSNRSFLNHANALPVQGLDVAMSACCLQVGLLPTTHKLTWKNSWNNTLTSATLKS